MLVCKMTPVAFTTPRSEGRASAHTRHSASRAAACAAISTFSPRSRRSRMACMLARTASVTAVSGTHARTASLKLTSPTTSSTLGNARMRSLRLCSVAMVLLRGVRDKVLMGKHYSMMWIWPDSPSTTRPIFAGVRPQRARNSSSNAAAVSAGMAHSMPPDVCGSHSTAVASSPI